MIRWTKIALAAVLVGTFLVGCQDKSEDKDNDKETEIVDENAKEPGVNDGSKGDDKDGETSGSSSQNKAHGEAEVSDGLTYYSGILVVNKKHSLPKDYAPGEDEEAVEALQQLISDMQLLGYDISNGYSGFRSYETQNQLYNNYVSSYGQVEADTFSARPGYSEHQTGLAFDLLHNDGSLVEGTAEAKWIAENAHQYGFIVRYQSGKEGITGYQAEPWHLRYIGDEAEAIYQSGKTLEEYLGAPGGDY